MRFIGCVLAVVAMFVITLTSSTPTVLNYENEVVDKYAAIIASKSPLTLKIGKEAFYRQIEMPLEEAYDYAARVMVENMLARDAAEGIGAFLDKRHPTWTGE